MTPWMDCLMLVTLAAEHLLPVLDATAALPDGTVAPVPPDVARELLGLARDFGAECRTWAPHDQVTGIERGWNP